LGQKSGGTPPHPEPVGRDATCREGPWRLRPGGGWPVTPPSGLTDLNLGFRGKGRPIHLLTIKSWGVC